MYYFYRKYRLVCFLAAITLILLLCGCGFNKDIRSLECDIDSRSANLDSMTTTLHGRDAAKFFDYIQQYNSYISIESLTDMPQCSTLGGSISVAFRSENSDSIYQGRYTFYRSDYVGYSPSDTSSHCWYSKLPDGSFSWITAYVMSLSDKGTFDFKAADSEGFTCKVENSGSETLLTGESALELYRGLMRHSDRFDAIEECDIHYNELEGDGISLVFSDGYTSYGAFMFSESELYFAYGEDFLCERLSPVDGLYDEISHYAALYTS